MKIIQAVVLTVEEAKKELAQFFADYLADDRDNLLELISEGKLNRAVPNLPELTDIEVAQHYAEFEFLADQHLNSNATVAAISRCSIWLMPNEPGRSSRQSPKP
jgi:hypothetical protein